MGAAVKNAKAQLVEKLQESGGLAQQTKAEQTNELAEANSRAGGRMGALRLHHV